jgi:sec-independent protein translocase protein TatB
MFDFGVGYTELFVLALVAVIVIGPKDLPRLLRTFGQFMNKARGMAREFQTHVDAAMKESGVADIKKEMTQAKGAISSVMTAPNVLSAIDQPGRTSSDKSFGSYFGAEPKAGETRVAGELVDQGGTAT